MIYREIALLLEKQDETPAQRPMYSVSVDEKPGVQALANTAPDLPSVPGKHATIARDHEYVRQGTVSIIAGIDLLDGHVFGQVHERHRSREFIALLKELDTHYSPEAVIRVIVDNHSAHISKETILAEPDRSGILQNGTNLPAPYPGHLEGRA